jgi:hypothetical protein
MERSFTMNTAQKNMRAGLVIVADANEATRTGSNAAAIVHALEWIAQHSQGAVVALFWSCLGTSRRFRPNARLSCRGRLQETSTPKNQDGGPGQLQPLVRRGALTPVRVGAAPIARIGCPPGRSPSRTGQSRSPRLGRLPAPRQLGVGPTWRRGSGRDN